MKNKRSKSGFHRGYNTIIYGMFREAFYIQIDKAMERLDEGEKFVIIQRHGLKDYRPKTLAEVAEIYRGKRPTKNAQNDHGVTRERVRQIEARAFRKMRKVLKFIEL